MLALLALSGLYSACLLGYYRPVTWHLAAQPVHLHGSYGREAATGRGTVFATRELLKAFHMGGISGKTFVIQARAPPCFAHS